MSQEIKNEKWKELFEKQKSQTASNKEIIENIDSYYFIYDSYLNEISFINSAFETITGYNSKDFTVEQLIEMIHPKDQPYFFECEEKGLSFTNNLLYNEHFQYIISYTYRIKTGKGEYIWIKQQCQALEVNNQGHLTKTLVIHQRIKNKNYTRPINDHRIFNKTKNIYMDAENCYNLSKRELEIFQLIQDGFSSIEIAKKLFISKHTIDTHRKNILKKTDSTNFIDLIQKISTT